MLPHHVWLETSLMKLLTSASPLAWCVMLQVSQDGTTLRWSWQNYVRLFYVDEIICNDADMTICITMTAVEDLLLSFPNKTM